MPSRMNLDLRCEQREVAAQVATVAAVEAMEEVRQATRVVGLRPAMWSASTTHERFHQT